MYAQPSCRSIKFNSTPSDPKQTPEDALEPPPEPGFPATLCRWVGEIVQSSPEGTRLTLLELIIGALLASGGHVTQAFLALTPRLGWHTGCSNGSGCSA